MQPSAMVLVEELIPLLRRLVIGEYGIALGGAHAKGVDDAESDLDIYIFTKDALNNTERARQATAFSSDITQLICWGQENPFEQCGTDFYYKGTKVECWMRASAIINRAIADCREGIITRDYVTWTTTGFYNHVALSDLRVMKSVDDPTCLLARWQTAIAEYPPKLREAIIKQHLPAARYWPSNFHYTSAVERQDIIYTTGIVAQVAHNLIQVLFALNRAYFPGDKKLANALAHLERTPRDCAKRINRLLWPGEPLSVELLRAQQAELQALLREVEELVAEG